MKAYTFQQKLRAGGSMQVQDDLRLEQVITRAAIRCGDNMEAMDAKDEIIWIIES
jgi:hypothetical protein